MFEDILGKDAKRSIWDWGVDDENTIVVCPKCGVRIIEITTPGDEKEPIVVDWDHYCKQCGGGKVK